MWQQLTVEDWTGAVATFCGRVGWLELLPNGIWRLQSRCAVIVNLVAEVIDQCGIDM